MKKMNVLFVLFVMLVGLMTSQAYAAVSDSTIISVSLINQDPDPALSGDIVELRVGIENKGGVAAENLVFEVVPQYPFTAVTGESLVQNVGTVNAYQSGSDMRIIKFKVRVDKDASAGQYALKLKEYIEGGKSSAVQRSISIDVKSKESAEVIHIDKTTIIPGKQTGLKFRINNVGNAPLRDLTFYWENEDGVILPVGSDNTRYVKYIEIGESAEIEYQVIADSNVDAGLYKLNLYLTYEDSINHSTKKVSTIAGIYIGGGTDFDIAFSESSGSQMSFTIANIGSNPASSVSVIVPQQDGWRVTGAGSMIIGNLNVGDYTVASFALQQSMQAVPDSAAQTDQQRNMNQQRASSQTPNLKIQIAYTDTMGTRELVEKEVAMSAQSLTNSTSTGLPAGAYSFRRGQQQSFFSKYKWYFAVLIALVIVGVLYRIKHQKTKRLNTNIKVKDVFKGHKLH